jgi:hypothetical protein
VTLRDIEDWGFEAEESLPPALPAEAIQAAIEDPKTPTPEIERRADFSGAATLALLTFLAALLLIWVSGIFVLIRWAVGALSG